LLYNQKRENLGGMGTATKFNFVKSENISSVKEVTGSNQHSLGFATEFLT